MFAGSSKATSFLDVGSFKKGFNLILYEHKNLTIVNPGICTWAENTSYGWNIKVINIYRLPKQNHSFRFPDLLDPTCKFSLLATIWDIFQNIQLHLSDLGRKTPKWGCGGGGPRLTFTVINAFSWACFCHPMICHFFVHPVWSFCFAWCIQMLLTFTFAV